MNLRRQLNFEHNELTVEVTKPTWNIFVRTYGVFSQDAEYQLKTVFSQNEKQRHDVLLVQRLEGDCFEITCTKGWGTFILNLLTCKKKILEFLQIVKNCKNSAITLSFTSLN